MTRPALSDEQMNDVTWIGSSYFLDTSGFYDTFHSMTARTNWPYDNDRDMGLAQVNNGGGYPTCRQWWLDADGLRARLLNVAEPDLLTRIGHWAGFLTQNEVGDSLVRVIASPRQQIMNQGAVYTDYGGQIDKTFSNVVTRGAADLGATSGALGAFPAMDAVRQALPMVLSFLKLAITICIPLVLLIGTYDLKTVVTLSVVEFAVFFVDFWFQLARWIDSTILDALYGWDSPHANFNLLIAENNDYADLLLNLVMGTMFIVLPMFWVTGVSWAGIRTAGILSGLTMGTAATNSATSRGTDFALNSAKQIINSK